MRKKSSYNLFLLRSSDQLCEALPGLSGAGVCGHCCRGGFSQANAALFGSASSVKQQDSQQLEVPKPAHSGKHTAFTDQTCRVRGPVVGAGSVCNAQPFGHRDNGSPSLKICYWPKKPAFSVSCGSAYCPEQQRSTD